jgi:hypothetical protein
MLPLMLLSGTAADADAAAAGTFSTWRTNHSSTAAHICLLALIPATALQLSQHCAAVGQVRFITSPAC